MERVGQSLKLTDRKDLEKDKAEEPSARSCSRVEIYHPSTTTPQIPTKQSTKHAMVDMKNAKARRVAARRFEHHADHGAGYPEVACTYCQCAKILNDNMGRHQELVGSGDDVGVAILGTDQKKFVKDYWLTTFPGPIPSAGRRVADVPPSWFRVPRLSTVSHLSELITPLNGTSPKEVVVTLRSP